MKKYVSLVLWLLLAALWLCPQLLPAQQTRSGVHLTRTTVDEVMNYIEEHSDYTFLYNDKTVDRTRRVSVDNAAGDIRAILDAVFAGTDVRYDIRDNQIILSEKRPQKQAGRDDMIAGRVTDQNGVPLAGVSILVKGSARGTTTDVSGRFVLRIEPGDVLVASYLGYESVEVAADSRTGVEIRMQESSKALDAVVVTALGIKRSEKALSYNVQGVQGEDMNIVKDANFMNSLAGKVAGVSINASAGGVGGATRVVMRGTKSISGNNNALYVIDGVPILNVTGGSVDSEYGLAGGEGISDINPEDIESVNVLTGPSAAALYGSAAANGVVLINTRKGSAGKPKITVSNNTTFSNPFMMPEFQNTYGNKIGIYASWGEKLAKPSSFDPADFFNTGALVQNNVSLSTGNDRHQTYISAGTTNGTTAPSTQTAGNVIYENFYNWRRNYANGEYCTVYDFSTGYSWKLRIMTKDAHMDAEPATAEDTAIMLKAFGGKTTWAPKAVWVTFSDGKTYIGSTHDVPHSPQHLSNNNFNGHLCVHFPISMEKAQSIGPYATSHQEAINEGWAATQKLKY